MKVSKKDRFIYCIFDLGSQNSHKGQFIEIEINNLRAERISFPLMYDLFEYDTICPKYNYLNIWNLSVQINQNIEKIAFKVFQMKFLAMHITNRKLSFDIHIFFLYEIYKISSYSKSA